MAVDSFFYIHFADEPQLAFADSPHDPELGKRVRAGGWIADWKELNFELGTGLLVDSLANSFAFRLCSERLQDVVEHSRAHDDVVQWLPTIRARSVGVALLGASFSRGA